MQYIKKYLIFKFDRKLLTTFRYYSNSVYEPLKLILQVYDMNIFYKHFNAFCAIFAHNKKPLILGLTFYLVLCKQSRVNLSLSNTALYSLI